MHVTLRTPTPSARAAPAPRRAVRAASAEQGRINHTIDLGNPKVCEGGRDDTRARGVCGGGCECGRQGDGRAGAAGAADPTSHVSHRLSPAPSLPPRTQVVHTVDASAIDKQAVYCRCWRSATFPACDGAHVKHNKDCPGGDNVGPLIVKKE